jgi:hypothetical protein
LNERSALIGSNSRPRRSTARLPKNRLSHCPCPSCRQKGRSHATPPRRRPTAKPMPCVSRQPSLHPNVAASPPSF